MLRGDDALTCSLLVDQWRNAEPRAREPEILMAAEEPARYGEMVPLLERGRSRFDFRLVDNPFELEENLRGHVITEGATVRLVASFARPWKTRDAADPHQLAPEMLDFCFRVGSGSRALTWARPWNVVPDGDDYTAFIQASPDSRMSSDPLAEVGCPYAVRGFDFDYVGLIWLQDLRWRSGHWQIFPQDTHETGLQRTLARARTEGDPFGPHHTELLRRIQQAYRILLTRAIKGLYVWCPDVETRNHLASCLGE